MALTAVIPMVFYEDLDVGIAFFCDALGFRNAWRAEDESLCIVRRDQTALHLCRDAERARMDRPQLRIATDDIESYHREITERAAHVLHPNGRTITAKPWGLREFALLDRTNVCVIIEQPVSPPHVP